MASYFPVELLALKTCSPCEFLVTLLWVGKNISWNYKLSRTIPDVLIRFLTMYCVYLCFLFVYQKQKKRAEGYEEGDYTLFRSAKVSDFLQTEHPLDILCVVNEVCFMLNVALTLCLEKTFSKDQKQELINSYQIICLQKGLLSQFSLSLLEGAILALRIQNKQGKGDVSN